MASLHGKTAHGRQRRRVCAQPRSSTSSNRIHKHTTRPHDPAHEHVHAPQPSQQLAPKTAQTQRCRFHCSHTERVRRVRTTAAASRSDAPSRHIACVLNGVSWVRADWGGDAAFVATMTAYSVTPKKRLQCLNHRKFDAAGPHPGYIQVCNSYCRTQLSKDTGLPLKLERYRED